MPRQSTTTPPGTPATSVDVRPISITDETIGGKARSLARLSALGLPVPPAFAISAAVFKSLRASGPPEPTALRSAADLAQLDAARAALLAAPAPAGFDDHLRAAVDDLIGAQPTLPATDGFAVRSSGVTEDRAGALAPGVFASRVRVPVAAVGGAVREVLASYLQPAARMYAASAGDHGRAGALAGGGGVLIHPFVVGTSFGVCACDPTAPTGREVVLVEPSSEAPAAPTARARAEIERGARLAAAAHGPSELEWVSDGDRVLFLQLRAYRAPGARATAPGVDWSEAAGWTWDAAHNPSALSPAQAGLVQLVDARCHIGLQQRVLGGYLFFRPDAAAPAPTPDNASDPRALFERVRTAVEGQLQGLPPDASLATVLEVYVAGYQGLYGEVGPVLAHARRALLDYLQPRVPRPQTTAAELLANVPSIAVERRAAARAIALATTASARQAAVDAYLRRFGDESGGWDVIEPTFGEDPTRLLLLGGATREGAQHRAPAGEPSPAAGEPPLAADDEARFRVVVDRARAAVAVGEDDDALFARLQAAVRRALLRLGGKLVTQGSLDEPAHVFFLPLVLSASLDDAPTAPELRAIVATNREAWTAARRSPPTPARPDAPADIIRIRGLPGGAGRAIGHAVHHPSSAPLASDSILIASTLLPTELPLLFPAAVVVETGGILGHVAAQARERNLPAVVSAPGARTIREGSLILVDGDRGEVVVLEA